MINDYNIYSHDGIVISNTKKRGKNVFSILVNIFINDKDDVKNPRVRQRYGMLCGIVGIVLNLLLFSAKFLAGLISRSISITADAFNNLSDAASSVVTLAGFKMAGAKPDVDHPYGHGRIEYITGFIVSGAILVMAFELIKSSVGKIVNPAPVEFRLLSVGILLLSILVKIYMACYNYRIGRKLDSTAMRAAATDSLSDTCATSVVLLGIIVGKLTGLRVDGWCGVLVGVFIFYAGITAAKDTLNPLLGQPPEAEFVTQIEEIVLAHEEIYGVHDLLVHDYGPGRCMISLHAEVPAEGNILELHEVVDDAEVELQDKLNCNAVIHMDPVVTEDTYILQLKGRIEALIKTIDPIITMHDFRVVPKHVQTKLIFDVVVPYGYRLDDEELVEVIEKRIGKELQEDYLVVIQVDKAYLK